MLNEVLIDAQQYTIRVRPRGQVTLPRKLRNALAIEEGDLLTLVQVGDAIFLTAKPPRTYELADKIADMMTEEGVSLADLLQDLPKIREDLFQERYGQSRS